MTSYRIRALAAVLAGAAFLAPAAARPAPQPVDVAIVTSMGTIVVELDLEHAPITAGNFLKHVDAGAYNHDATFYRTVHSEDPQHPARIEIIQGGIDPKDDPTPPIPLELTTTTGLHNTSGTIAMARDTAPNTATSEFYINLGDDTRLDSEREPDHNGYAVFGRVISGEDVARAIQRRPAVGEYFKPRIKIVSIARVKP